jgi:membrane associated rhomboid family serine protease
MGPVRYLVFYLPGGLVATMAQVLVAPNSTVPNLGASGAIAALMGVFLVIFLRDRIRTILLFGWFWMGRNDQAGIPQIRATCL